MLWDRLAVEREEVVLTGPRVWLGFRELGEVGGGRGGGVDLVAGNGVNLGQVGLVSLGLSP